MAEVVSIHFKNNGKIYYFDPNGITVSPGDDVIIETSKGLEYAKCSQGNHQVDDSEIVPPLRPIIRIATPEDAKKLAENKA